MIQAITILRVIDYLERELYSKYTHEEIQKAIHQESTKEEFLNISNSLINTIDKATKNK